MVLQRSVDLFFRPRAAFRSLLEGSRPVSYGFYGNLILAMVYFAGISISLAMNVMHIPQGLVLNIPPEQYYAYERFFIFPVGLAGTILAAGAIRLGACGCRGQGHFEDLFALLGFSAVELAVVMGLPDLLLGILAGFRVIVPRGFAYVGPHVILGTVWYLLLTILAVKEAERLGWKESILLGLLGFAANGLVSFIFIR